MMSDDSLGGGKGNIPHRDDWNRCHVDCAVACESGNYHPNCAEKLTDVKRAAFTQPGDDSTGQAGRNYRGADADKKKRSSDAPWIPGEAIDGVERPNCKNFV